MPPHPFPMGATYSDAPGGIGLTEGSKCQKSALPLSVWLVTSDVGSLSFDVTMCSRGKLFNTVYIGTYHQTNQTLLQYLNKT